MSKFTWEPGELEITRASPLTEDEAMEALDAEIARVDAVLKAAGGDPDLDFADAAPSPLYVRRDVMNVKDITKWAKEQGLPALHNKLHVTLIYSRAPVDWMEMGQPWSSELVVPSGGPRQLEIFRDSLVLSFVASELVYRHEDMRRSGASFDYPKYQPHITLVYGGFTSVPAGLTPYQGELRLGPEIFEELDP